MNYPSQTNFSKICRTCLSENISLKSVFGEVELLEGKIMLCDMLMSCTSLLVLQGDGHPENICTNCTQQLKSAYLFRKLCERSEATLRECTSITTLSNDQNLFSIEQHDEFEQFNTNSNTAVDERYMEQEFLDGSGTDDREEGDFKCERKQQRKKNDVIQKHSCDICSKTFRYYNNLERHKLVHTGEKPCLCNVCGKSFAQMSYLKIHSFIHSGEKPYKCKICGKSFTAPGTLTAHMRTHTGKRPYMCKICGKDFSHSGYLPAHMRTHTGEKPIECRVCGHRFNQSGRLRVHMRVHSGEKPYQCTMCDRSFSIRSTMKKHLRTHTGEKPYKCKVCSQTFAQNGTLNTHMKIHGPKEADNEKLMFWSQSN